MARKPLKVGMPCWLEGVVLGFQDMRSGQMAITVQIVSNGEKVSFDRSWLPDAETGDRVRLPGRLTRVALPKATVKLDAFGTPTTARAEDVIV